MLPSTQSTLELLVNKLEILRTSILESEESHQNLLRKIHINYHYNALNLLRYLKLRTFDLREIQSHLTVLGVSSLSHSERQVLANIENILYLLNAQLNQSFTGKFAFGAHPVNYMESAKRLHENTQRLFGDHVDKMGIMVTLPTEAADPAYLEMLLKAGMNIARINCSHDGPEIWLKMVENLKRVSEELQLPCSIYADLAGPKIRTDKIWTLKKKWHKKESVRLWEGDHVYVWKAWDAERSEELKMAKATVITCTLPSIIDDAMKGQRIWFDDGQIGGCVEEKWPGVLKVKITHSSPKGIKLKPEKGINLPDTHLNLPSLTEEDIANLDFITSHADIVGFSFVRRKEDVERLQEELVKRNRAEMGIVLKIENKEAFENLPSLILKGMESPTLGIMTARGDLAVELGAERLSEVQEQIMWLCEAALIPNIWATQVLESLAKNGVASRAEITDAAMSVRAECVMLNKGPYIEQALKTLVNILARMEQHVFKKQATLRKLTVAENFWEKIEKK